MTVTPAALEPVLSLHEVTMRYGEREALRAVSFSVRAGELVAVVGPNGAGKTTLLSILAGVQRPSAGVVRSLAGDGRVGWAPQQVALYSKLSVQENLELFARLERVADPRAAVARMLEQTGLLDRAHDRLDRLSGGNRQRVNVALGLLADPPVLILDEPSSSLDPNQRARLWGFLGALVERGTSVVFSTHDVSEVERYARRAIVLAEGELLFDGPPRGLIEETAVEGDLEDAFVGFLAKRGH